MARATNSFPVPLSPVISTVVSVGPTVSMASNTRRMGALLPTSSFGTRDLRVLLAQALVFLLRPLVRERLAHLEGDVFRVERLGHVIVGAVLHRRHGRLHRGIAGHHDGDQPRIDLVHPALQFDAVGAAHLDVEQRDVPLLLGQRSSASLAFSAVPTS